MSLTTYNFFWGMVKFILPSYLERRQKKGKEDIHRINERFGISKNNRPDGTLVWLHGTSVGESVAALALANSCLLYTSPSPRDRQKSRMPSSA